MSFEIVRPDDIAARDETARTALGYFLSRRHEGPRQRLFARAMIRVIRIQRERAR